jgi:hypothetical protein
VERNNVPHNGKVSFRARIYLENIEKHRWWSSKWVHDRSLPPRFGILNSKTAESANAMFEGARNGTWLDTIVTILDIMSKGISVLREEYKGEKGVTATTAALLQTMRGLCRIASNTVG